MKYKVVACLDILLGIIFAGIPIYVVYFSLPKLREMYTSFDIKLPLFTQLALNHGYFLISIFIAIAAIPFFISYKLLSPKNFNKDLYYKIGFFLIFLLFLSLGILSAFLVMIFVYPVYNISKQFWFYKLVICFLLL